MCYVEVSGYDWIKLVWGVVGYNVVNETSGSYEIGLWGFGIHFFDEYGGGRVIYLFYLFVNDNLYLGFLLVRTVGKYEISMDLENWFLRVNKY